MKCWAESVDRVLEMRRVAQLERDKAELIRIIQEMEQRCRVVVNRQASEVLKDVPSWKSEGTQPAADHKSFRRGMRTWKEQQLRLEAKHRVEAEKQKRRRDEFVEVLTGTGISAQAALVSQEESSDGEQTA